MRSKWKSERERIREKLLAGTYSFDCVRQIETPDGIIEIWAASDAVVIKALEMVLKKLLMPVISSRCYNAKGRGGIKEALRQVEANKPGYEFVLKTDVKNYYASIGHDVLLDKIRGLINESAVTSLIYKFLKHVKYKDGCYMDVKRGISRGTSLSPLLGALYLSEVDEAMEKMNVFYARFVDDIIVMAKNRWTFRRSIRTVNRILERLGLEKAGKKTFIGKIDRGFDFLGFHFNSLSGMMPSEKTVLKFADNVVLKLETCKTRNTGKITPVIPVEKCRSGSAYGTWRFQDKNKKGDLLIPETVSAYIRRWVIWVKSMYGQEKDQVLQTFP